MILRNSLDYTTLRNVLKDWNANTTVSINKLFWERLKKKIFLAI